MKITQLRPTLYDRQVQQLLKRSMVADDKKRNSLDREGISILSQLFVQYRNQWVFNPSVSADDNAESLNRIFRDIMRQLQNYFIYVSKYGVEYGKNQVIEQSKRSGLLVKATYDFEIEVNWAKADENVLNWLNGGGDYVSGHFDMITGMVESTNRHWLRDRYSQYINGDITLEQTQRELTDIAFSYQRADLIIRTNVTDIFASGQQEAYRASGHIQNEWFTRFDERVCPICGRLHSQRAIIGQPFPGTNIDKPAAHAGCRCFLAPVPLTTEELRNYLRNEKLLPNAKIKPRKKPPVVKPTKPVIEKPTIIAVDKQSIEDSPAIEYEAKRNHFIDKILGIENNTNDRMIALQRQIDDLEEEIYKSSMRMVGADGPTVTKEIAKHDKMAKKQRELKKNLEESIQSARDSQIQAIFDINGEDIQIRKWDDIDGRGINPIWREGLSIFDRMISKVYETPDRAKVERGPTTGHYSQRSYYQPSIVGDYNYIAFSSNANKVTVVHELGHWLDNGNRKLHDVVLKFLERRTKGEKEVRINQIPGYENRGYRDDEVTKVDKFENAYMGRVYDFGITEITSMGLQKMYENPLKFYHSDRDYFNFIYDVMTGKAIEDGYEP
jgi:SPP1 gp7 family putative phage head morphogenesis protein